MVVYFTMISSVVVCTFQIGQLQLLQERKHLKVLPVEKVTSMSFIIQEGR